MSIKRSIKRFTLPKTFKKGSTKKSGGNKQAAQGNAQSINKKKKKNLALSEKNLALSENNGESKLEVKADVESQSETTSEVSHRAHKHKTFRRLNTFGLSKLEEKEKNKKKLVHHSDALFYLHASPKHLEKHVSLGKYMDSIRAKAGEMVGQRTKYRNGESTWAYHGNDNAESDTDWDTDESGAEGELAEL